MSRGPPAKAIDTALPIASARGVVTICSRGRGGVCDIMIHAAEYNAVVMVVRCRRLHGSLGEMEREFAEHLARLRLVPAGLCRSLEHWACNYYGGVRFFRISGPGLIEIDRHGELLLSAEKIPGTTEGKK